MTLAQLSVDSTAQALVTCFKYSLSLWEERKFLDWRMSWLFRPRKTPADLLRENKRSLDKGARVVTATCWLREVTVPSMSCPCTQLYASWTGSALPCSRRRRN